MNTKIMGTLADSSLTFLLAACGAQTPAATTANSTAGTNAPGVSAPRIDCRSDRTGVGDEARLSFACGGSDTATRRKLHLEEPNYTQCRRAEGIEAIRVRPSSGLQTSDRFHRDDRQWNRRTL